MQAKELLAEIRANGMTQAAVAKETGIPQSTISKIERGAVNDVMSRNYQALQKLRSAILRRPGPAKRRTAKAA